MAGVCAQSGQPERGALLLGAAESLLDAAGASIWPSNRDDVARTRTAIEQRMGAAAFAAAHERGRRCSQDRAVAQALADA